MLNDISNKTYRSTEYKEIKKLDLGGGGVKAKTKKSVVSQQIFNKKARSQKLKVEGG